MILDRVDYDNVASTFRFGRSKITNFSCASSTPHRGISNTIPTSTNEILTIKIAGSDHLSREHKERDMIERAKQRRTHDADQARRKLAEKEANARIRQVKDYISNKHKDEFEPSLSQKSKASDGDSGVDVVFEPPKKAFSQTELQAKIVSRWRAKARWSKAIKKVRSISMSSARSNGSPGKQGQNDLLSPVTPTRTRASSTGSIR